jgi:recombination protein RecT
MTSTSVADIATGKKPETPIAKFSSFLDKLKPQMAVALPKHMNADRMARLALTAFSTSPALQKCTPQSIAGSIMTAAQLGLEPGINGQCYLIAYKETCTCVPGWKGLVDLVARSGRATVWTGAVFPGDKFDYQLGDEPYCRHVPSDDDGGAQFTHVYAIGRVRDSTMAVIEVWSRAKVAKHLKQYNKVGARHYANESENNFAMYARKVALLQVLKYMPASVELATAIEVSNAAEEGRGVVLDGDFLVTRTDEHTDPDTGEITGGGAADPAKGKPKGDVPPTLSQLKDRIKGAADKDDAALILDSARDALDGTDLTALGAFYREVWESQS